METYMGALDKFRKAKVLFGIPSLGQWTEQFGMSQAAMTKYFLQNPLPGYGKNQELLHFSVKGSMLPRLRMDIVKRALLLKCTHILQIDCDQTFPPQTLHRLISLDKDVVAANIAVKRIPSAPTARLYDAADPRGKVLYTPEKSEELERVWRVGTGIMLTKIKVFETIGPGVFEIKWRPEWQDYQGEDWSMCEAMERHGFDIWVDHGLSNRVGHIGDYSYDHNVVGEIMPKESRENG